jgi:hypothetical protein
MNDTIPVEARPIVEEAERASQQAMNLSSSMESKGLPLASTGSIGSFLNQLLTNGMCRSTSVIFV